MKYGRVDIPLLNFENDYSAIEENLKKGEITEQEAQKLRKDLGKVKIAYLIGTNKLPLRTSARYGENLGNMGTTLKKMGYKPLYYS